jgi:signal transduction histidine kinase
VLFDGPVDLTPDDVATELLAALREALANVARHARARSVDIEVVSDGDLVLRVTDDGQGLPTERRAGGHGLANMEARASRLGGSMLARRGPQSGTAIEWRVPNRPVS